MTNEELIEEARNHAEHYPITEGDALRVARLADALEKSTAELAAANAVIANALAQTERGNVMTPPHVIAVLTGHLDGNETVTASATPITAALDLLADAIEDVEAEWGVRRSVEELRAAGDQDTLTLDAARAALRNIEAGVAK